MYFKKDFEKSNPSFDKQILLEKRYDCNEDSFKNKSLKVKSEEKLYCQKKNF